MDIGRIAFAPTPGPWRISSLDRRTVGPVRLLTAEGTDVPQLQAVAVVKERGGESEANARLIAAAPDLLAALKAVIANHCENDELFCSTCSPARAVIARVEGQ